jgi:hypothetical protein
MSSNKNNEMTNYLLCKKPETGVSGSQTATRVTVGETHLRSVQLSAEFFATSELGFLGIAADRGLGVVGGSHARQLDPIQFRPEHPPIVRAQVLSCDETVSRQLKRNAVFWAGRAVGIFVLPLPQLRITLYWIPERFHARSQLSNTECTGGREVLIEVHEAMIVAFATTCKQHLLRVARATLRQ